MNALLANVLMVNIWGVAVNQFTALAFEDYTRLTALENIFAIQLKHLNFFVFFFKYNVFNFAMFGFMIIGVGLIIYKRCCRGAKKVFCDIIFVASEPTFRRTIDLILYYSIIVFVLCIKYTTE